MVILALNFSIPGYVANILPLQSSLYTGKYCGMLFEEVEARISSEMLGEKVSFIVIILKLEQYADVLWVLS